ncbi:hypothetical protein HY407_04600 [Candidatus Gottesmanbacteria bacterium]|nr:hypothetical protein [Candidatus Gottesmanbacteria bacterium]
MNRGEDVSKLPPLDRLKVGLTEDARRATVPELWKGRIGSHGFANQLPRKFAHIREFRSSDPSTRADGQEYLEKCRVDYGFDSVDQLITAVVQLREELKSQLTSEDYDAYFGRSLDVK